MNVSSACVSVSDSLYLAVEKKLKRCKTEEDKNKVYVDSAKFAADKERECMALADKSEQDGNHTRASLLRLDAKDWAKCNTVEKLKNYKVA